MTNFIRFLINIFDFFTQKKIFDVIHNELGSNLLVFVDVGSHMGEYIIQLLKRFNVQKAYAFEPNPTIFKKLSKNVRNIRNIEIFDNGVGHLNEKKILHQNIESSSSSICPLNINSKYYKKKFTILNFFNLKKISKSIEVDLIKLEDFLNNKKIIQVDLLKIDTEGSEFNVLKGLNKSIKKVKLIHLEHHFDDMIIKNYKLSDIHEYLLNNNFEKIFKIKMKFRKSFEYIYKNKFLVN
jgi:FkbM family methyltransferase|tara:strand:+ start:411 stop:1124 length:714 start_codon:yes stop_codon:yes gene_type:complete